MARDVFTDLHWCRYCGRTAVATWAPDIRTCTREVCKGLAFSEVRRREREASAADPAAGYVRALLRALATIERSVGRDVHAELLTEREGLRIRDAERARTAQAIADVRRLVPRVQEAPPRFRSFRDARRVRPPRVRGVARVTRRRLPARAA